MRNRPPLVIWLVVLVSLSGCADSMDAVMRDYYNAQHEALDNMAKVADEDSAKAYNDFYRDRIADKEKRVQERKEKLNIAADTNKADREALDKKILKLETETLKNQVETLEKRFRYMQARHRKLIVRLVEDKANEEKRSQTKTFTVKSSDVCPNLSELVIPDKIPKPLDSERGLGGGGGGMMPGGMAPGGMAPGGMAPGGVGPGGPGPGPAAAAGPGAGPGPGPAGGGAPGGGQQKGGAAIDARANTNMVFGITCVRDGNGWRDTRWWGSPNNPAKDVIVNGVDLTPYSAQ